jgi:hypothetical protein
MINAINGGKYGMVSNGLINSNCQAKMKITYCSMSAFTPKTKIVYITHVINWNRQIFQ